MLDKKQLSVKIIKGKDDVQMVGTARLSARAKNKPDIIALMFDTMESYYLDRKAVKDILSQLVSVKYSLMAVVRNVNSVHPDLRMKEGFKREGHDLNRIDLLRAAAEPENAAQFVEIEDRYIRNIFFDTNLTKIVSVYYDFDGVLLYDDLRKVYDKMHKRAGDILKVEGIVDDIISQKNLLRLLTEHAKGSERPLAIRAHGTLARETNALAGELGSHFVYID